MDIASNEIQVTAAARAFESKLKGALDAVDAGKAEQAAQAFEKLFASMLVRELSRGLSEGFFGDGPGADTFTGWFEEHLGAALSAGRGLGVAEEVRASLIQKQGHAEVAGSLAPQTEFGPTAGGVQ
jgi:Rod binding domain-containing protein